MKFFFLHFWPVIIIFSIWFIFAAPYFLKGKVPFPSTYQVNNFAPWSAYPELAGPVKNGAMPDIISQMYPWKHFTIETWKQGEIPLWNPNSFSGTPHLANYQSAVLSPFNILFFVLPFVDAWSLLILLQPLLAGIFGYLFIRKLMVSQVGSLITSISWMFCGFITVWMDYGTLAYAILFLPLALYAVEQFIEVKKVKYTILLSATIPLSFFSGHFQTSLYFFILLIAYIIFRSWGTWKLLWQLLLYCFFGILLVMPQILPTMEFYQQSIRSGIYSGVEVIPWGYLPTFLAPDFLGNPVTRNDWFGHYAEWNAYVGIVAFLLAPFAFVKKSKVVLFFGSVGLIAFLLAFPTPLLSLVVALHLPVLSTSAASRIIVLFSFSIAVLGGIGYDKTQNILKEKNIRPIIIWTTISIIIYLLLWIIVLREIFIPFDHIAVAKQNLKLPTILSLVTIGIMLLGIFLYKYKQKKLLFIIPLGILLIVSFDMLRFSTKWQPFDPKSLTFTDVGVSNALRSISHTGKAVSKSQSELADYYDIPMLDGYDPLYISRYGIFITSLQTGKLDYPGRSAVVFPVNGLFSDKAINLLNATYIIHKVSDSNTPWVYPYWKYPANRFSVLFDDGHYRIYRNNDALPEAFLIGKYIVKTNPQSILSTIFGKDFNLTTTIVLEKDPHMQQLAEKGKITLQQQTANSTRYQIQATRPMLLFRSVPFYPGWHAKVDGKETNIYRADFAFQSIVVPAGKHSVTFSYIPMGFILGLGASGIGIISIIILSLYLNRQKHHTS